ncbi:hypothetical protein B0T20DRAFT_492965 [Sordaria brevicollis]|uniref:Uncharacterized protein n=1 Tax=Sordaria brevicollis TaxID=83679 RepID=A0AAE0PLV9_SORBR|nr:hypothetical protein B0T20DRAFT_492965 [Sordaria brevicollis]
MDTANPSNPPAPAGRTLEQWQCGHQQAARSPIKRNFLSPTWPTWEELYGLQSGYASVASEVHDESSVGDSCKTSTSRCSTKIRWTPESWFFLKLSRWTGPRCRHQDYPRRRSSFLCCANIILPRQIHPWVSGSWLPARTAIRSRPARNEEFQRVSKFRQSLTALRAARNVGLSCPSQERRSGLPTAPLDQPRWDPLLGGVLDAVLSLQVGDWAVLASRQCRSSSHFGNKIARLTKSGIQSSLGASYR